MVNRAGDKFGGTEGPFCGTAFFCNECHTVFHQHGCSPRYKYRCLAGKSEPRQQWLRLWEARPPALSADRPAGTEWNVGCLPKYSCWSFWSWMEILEGSISSFPINFYLFFKITWACSLQKHIYLFILRYNWHLTMCKFKVLIWYIYIL